MKIFALEGAAFAGKTTLINFLKKNYTDRVVAIPEAGECVGGDKNFPKGVPFASYEDAIASTHFFIEIEKRRCADAISQHLKSGLPVVMDRSTPVSSLLFYGLLDKRFPQLHHFNKSFYQHALEIFQKEVEKGTLFVPGGIVYLKPKNKSVFEDRLERGTKNGVFMHWKSFEFLNKEYQKMINNNFNEHNLVIDTENTTQNLENVANDTLSFIENPQNSPSFVNIFTLFQGRKIERSINPDPVEEEGRFGAIRKTARELMNKYYV